MLFTTKRTRLAAQSNFLITIKQASAQHTRPYSLYFAPAGLFFTAGAAGGGIAGAAELDPPADLFDIDVVEEADGVFVNAKPWFI